MRQWIRDRVVVLRGGRAFRDADGDPVLLVLAPHVVDIGQVHEDEAHRGNSHDAGEEAEEGSHGQGANNETVQIDAVAHFSADGVGGGGKDQGAIQGRVKVELYEKFESYDTMSENRGPRGRGGLEPETEPSEAYRSATLCLRPRGNNDPS